MSSLKAPDPSPSFGDTTDQQLTGKGDGPVTFSEMQALAPPMLAYSISTGARFYHASGFTIPSHVKANGK